MYLAIDTCTETAGLALLREDGTLRAELSWHAGRNHTAELHPALQDLLRQTGLTPSDLSGIVVAIGPGSFTGIRVGMATAKGLAMGLGIPMVGVETLEVAAYPFVWSGRTVWAVVDAGRGQVSAAAFRQNDDPNDDDPQHGLFKIVEERILSPEELCEAISRESAAALLCGELSETVEAVVRERLGNGVVIPPALHRVRRAGYLALLGWRRLRRGDADDAATLAPLYLRPPAALEKRA